MPEEKRPKGYKPGPTRLIQFSDQQLTEFLAAASDPMTAAAIREVLYLRREIVNLNRTK